ncbi:MAG: hypothetical protein ACI32F_02065 [Allobaculum sp.]
MNYKLMMRVVVQTEKEDQVTEVQQELQKLVPALSFSPTREEASLDGCLEFYATGKVDENERTLLVDTLDNDWDYDDEDDVYWAYGFNTKMFDSRVYYLELEFSKSNKA